jgi:cellulose synthase/poly-beta-1,6-N-acetylglucosamine synthase-like glycosyltransferase
MEIIAEALIFLYFLFTLILIPYAYNCFYLIWRSTKYTPPPTKNPLDYEKVTVQLPIYNEKNVIERLIDAVCDMDWPRDKMQILVLDDSTDETSKLIDSSIEKHRANGVDISVLRRESRVGYKAGALKNGLEHTEGKYIAIIDADFIPPRDFLTQTAAVIEADPKIGFVQARWDHVNRGYNMYTEAFSLAIDAYHIVEQAARSASGLILNFNGSAGLLRVEAIKEVGGWSWDTLSEDMDLSYQMQIAGWKSIYLRDLRVMGEIPINMSAFRTQQGRWARGSVQTAKKLLWRVLTSNKSLLQKFEATLHLTYYMVSLWMWLALIVVVPLIAMNEFPYITNPLYVTLLSICAVSSFSMYYEAIRLRNASLKKKLPYMGLLALIGYGISAKVSVEMLKGLARKGGHYERVPKFNIVKPGDRADMSYARLREFPWLEMVMLLYTSVGIFFAFVNGNWGIMMYLFVYFMGYFTIAYSIAPL